MGEVHLDLRGWGGTLSRIYYGVRRVRRRRSKPGVPPLTPTFARVLLASRILMQGAASPPQRVLGVQLNTTVGDTPPSFSFIFCRCLTRRCHLQVVETPGALGVTVVEPVVHAQGKSPGPQQNPDPHSHVTFAARDSPI